jgi:glycine cleavage system aminomethyltransferase T
MIRTTPFESLHKRFNANFKNYHNWSLPADYSDTMLESEKLYSHCATFDLSSFGRIDISGSNAIELVKFLVSSNIDQLNEKKSCWAVIANEKACIVDIVRIIALKNSYLILTSPPKREAVLKIAQASLQQLGLAGVSICDKTEETAAISLYGPASFELAKQILPMNLEELGSVNVKELSLFMFNVIIIRGSWLGIDGIEIITSSKAASLAGMAIGKYEEKGMIKPAGMDCLNRAFLEASLPLSIECRAEIEKYNPFSLAIADKIDFSRNFHGKQVLQSDKNQLSEKTVAGLKIKGLKSRHQNLRLQYDDGQIGWVDCIDYSKLLDYGIGLAIISAQYVNLREEVQIEGDGIIIGAEITNIPLINDMAAGLYK